jgi:hypothetical protein
MVPGEAVGEAGGVAGGRILHVVTAADRRSRALRGRQGGAGRGVQVVQHTLKALPQSLSVRQQELLLRHAALHRAATSNRTNSITASDAGGDNLGLTRPSAPV